MTVSAHLLRLLEERDGRECAWHGLACPNPDTLVPHHRANRGMGGRPSLDRIENLLLVCSHINGRMEDDTAILIEAMERGIKLPGYVDPADIPVTYGSGQSYWLRGDGTRAATAARVFPDG